MEMILCILLLMKGCMFCKYTPATLKKELGTRFFITDCTDFLLEILFNPSIRGLYDRRLPQFNIFLFNQLRNFTIHIISDQLTNGRSEVKIHRVKVFCHKTV